MKISIGGSRKATKWKVEDVTFEELAQRVSNPTVTPETFETYQKLDKASKDDLKDVGGFVLGELKGGKRSNATVTNRTGIALDLDAIGSWGELEEIESTLEFLMFKYCLYSTRKSTKNNPRVRILFELKRVVTPDEYEYLARKLCEIIGMQYCDPTTVQPARLMYWPSVSSDMQDEFIFESNLDFSPLDPDSLLNRVDDWRKQSEWPRFSTEDPDLKKPGNYDEDEKDPREKPGVIGLFNRAYSIPEALETFLSDVYEPTDKPDRYTYINGESTEGGVVYGRDKFGADVHFYSFHATDPYGGKKRNAFDLIRVWKFGDSNQQKSTKEMMEFASQDEKVKKLRNEETIEKMKVAQKEQNFGLPPPEKEKSKSDNSQSKEEEELNAYRKLLSKLTVDSKGKFEKTYQNYLAIMREDPKLKDKFYYDTFAVRPKVNKPLPWAGDYRNLPRNWEDDDVIGMMHYLETNYDMYAREKIKDSCRLSAKERLKHPVREYLESLEWDGTPRLETLLIDYFGAVDNIYTREVIRKSLIAAVARVEEPGVKFDNMPILIGSQGIGKSSFLYILGKDWFTDSYIDFGSKEGYQMLHGNWIVEIGELTGFYKKEVEQIKSFLSKREDEFRAPFDKYTQNHPRQCVIFGTTNAKTFLRDQTGNRRFWPVQLGIKEPTKSVFKDLPKEVDQIWAEAYFYYTLGEDLFLEGKSKELAEKAQDESLEADPKKDEIINFILEEIPTDWYNRTLSQRKLYWKKDEIEDEDFDYEENVETKKRNSIAPVEIWCELFGRNKEDFSVSDHNSICKILDSFPGLRKTRSTIFGKCYGRTRGYKITSEFYDWSSQD